MVESDNKKILKAQKVIVKGEHDADKMKRELRTHLPKGLFMTVDRHDVLDVLLRQDIIANQAKDIAAIDLRVVGNIFMSWIVTLPAGAILSILFFYIFKGIFS